MGLSALAFLAGVMLLQPLPVLPDGRFAWLLAPLALGLARSRRLRLLGVLLAGLAWAWWRADLLLSEELAADLEGRDRVVEGVIASVPEHTPLGVRFDLDVTSRGDQGPVPGRLRLGWYQGAPVLHAGDAWRLTVRLKRPHGFMNPGGFDYEAWLFQQRLRATGYVVQAGEHRRLARDPLSRPVDRLRQHLGDAMRRVLDGRPFAGVLVALATGDTQGISQAQWQVFRDTGTVHLMAISGTHITLVAGVMFFLARWLWAWPGTTVLRAPAPKVAAIAALTVAVGYAALSGFSIPTQRALVMLGVVMLGVLTGRTTTPGHLLALALVAVLLLDPLGVLTAGFWLSFATVALILYGMRGRLTVSGLWWRFGRVHVLVSLGLLPLTLLLFQRNPWVGPVANALAVPWVEFLVVPLTLAGGALLMLSDALGGAVLGLAERAVAGLWPLLQALAGWGLTPWGQWAPVTWTVVPAIVGVAWLLAPQGLPARWLGAVWVLPLLWLRPAGPGPGELWLTVLDVGQGLSAVVRTRHHALVYDTGPAFSPDFDAGAAVLVPFLRATGVSTVDTLILSHHGSDHTGGAASLLDQVPVSEVLSGDPGWTPGAVQAVIRHPCERGRRWRWDGVGFEVLYPPPGAALGGNDASCVLRVTGPAGGIVLPGDIERAAEQRLLRAGLVAPAQILVAPHHGSASSSGAGFVAAVRPRYVLFSVGYRNRFGFPRPQVVARYRALGAETLDTASCGAITLRMGAGGTRLESFRRSAARYWNARPPRAQPGAPLSCP